MTDLTHAAFADHLRVRACGVCVRGNTVLLVRHRLGPLAEFWAPPGGGVAFGERAVDALRRECIEETGLEVAVGQFLCVHEFIGLPLHAVELFFAVEVTGGTLGVGTDPELAEPIIEDVRFVDFDELNGLDPRCLHQLLRRCRQVSDLLTLRGHYASVD